MPPGQLADSGASLFRFGLVDVTPKVQAVGFPPPLLGESPMRLPILDLDADRIIIDKQPGIAVRQHPWHPAGNNLDAALNLQLEAGKPELLNTGALIFGSIYLLDRELSGPVIFGLNRTSVSALRNAHGSGTFVFVFELVARALPGNGTGEAMRADAPLLPHRSKPKLIPSTAKGKQARTDFDFERGADTGWCLWRGRTRFLRPHQIRAHAALLGIPAMGDACYGGGPIPTLAELKPKAKGRGTEKPAFDGVAVRLMSVSLDGGNTWVSSPRSKAFTALLRKLALA